MMQPKPVVDHRLAFHVCGFSMKLIMNNDLNTNLWNTNLLTINIDLSLCLPPMVYLYVKIAGQQYARLNTTSILVLKQQVYVI